MRKFADGDVVYVAHKGRTVEGAVVRYDNGKPYGSPFYVVDIGEYESVIVPAHEVELRFLIGRMAALSRKSNGV